MCLRVICRVGQNRIYTPYMTVYLVLSLPKILYVSRIYIIYMVLANPSHLTRTKGEIQPCVPREVTPPQQIGPRTCSNRQNMFQHTTCSNRESMLQQREHVPTDRTCSNIQHVPTERECSNRENMFQQTEHVPKERVCSNRESMLQQRARVPTERTCSNRESMF